MLPPSEGNEPYTSIPYWLHVGEQTPSLSHVTARTEARFSLTVVGFGLLVLGAVYYLISFRVLPFLGTPSARF